MAAVTLLSPALEPGRVPPGDELVLARLAAIVEQESGIELRPEKRFVVLARLSRRLRELGMTSLAAYYRLVSRDPAERALMVRRLCVHETRFFREAAHFQYLEQSLLPRWRSQAMAGVRSREVRVWSAACSSGEEPFSLAMVLLNGLPPESGWQVQVIATDLSDDILEQAKRATWPMERAAEVPEALRRRYLLRGVGSREGTVRAAGELRAAVTFSALNLTSSSFSPLGSFDLIFLRNVLIYFSLGTKRAVVDRVLQHLRPDGHLVVGHADSLNQVSARVQLVAPGVHVFPEGRAR